MQSPVVPPFPQLTIEYESIPVRVSLKKEMANLKQRLPGNASASYIPSRLVCNFA